MSNGGKLAPFGRDKTPQSIVSRNTCHQVTLQYRHVPSGFYLGFVELCAKIFQIMRNNFKDYARTFYQLCAPLTALYYTHLAFNIDNATFLVYHKHVTFICAVCSQQLRRDVTVRLVTAFALARLDYCNVIFVGLLMSGAHQCRCSESFMWNTYCVAHEAA